MWVLIRALTYSSLFIGFLLAFVPSRVLSWSGSTLVSTAGVQGAFGMLVTAIGVVIALWCIMTFVVLGKGTPAPFDPPRRLVIRGPYRFVRNPMYIGACLALTGAAIVYNSLPLLGYAVVFAPVMHLFVVVYEEPTLRTTFDGDYDLYCARVGRWLPKP
jgi:protein-S-isoprenylcysteine O-methyltransferase Ste14